MKRILLIFAFTALFAAFSVRASSLPTLSPGDIALANYFQNETAALSANCLMDIQSREDWESKRGEYRRQLQEMLGLWPMPERTDLKPVVTGKIEHEEFTMEKISFQASPGLYCTANLFVPKNLMKPAPTILYECGHYRLVTNGVSYGNKAAYQVDGAWFARNGYVCLVLDTLLAGEVQGIHTGTRDRGMWWWNSRGYTPAGVEAWFGIRALDYLCTRPEVDTNRFGITGHSGGGAYSWTVTALDDRIKVAAPLAGMADLQSHIGDGVIDSHCDCNFFVNLYRWDFPQLAALAAPRPLLIGGTDRDPLFHLDSTLRIYEKVRRIYQLCGATNKLGLAVAPGPHEETPELQLAVLRWFNRFLKGDEKPAGVVAEKFFTPEEVRVLRTLPTDAINTNIAETFVPIGRADLPVGQGTRPGVLNQTANELRVLLREKVFAGWPADDFPPSPNRVLSVEKNGLHLTAWDFLSQHDVTLRIYLVEDPELKEPAPVQLRVLSEKSSSMWLHDLRSGFGVALADEPADTSHIVNIISPLVSMKAALKSSHAALAFFAPRGVGLNAFSADEKMLAKIRRRFMALGQTLDGMRVWDIRRAIQAVHYVREDDRAKIELQAEGMMAVNALYASLFELNVRSLDLTNLPQSHTIGPDYLGVLKILDIPQAVELEARSASVTVDSTKQ